MRKKAQHLTLALLLLIPAVVTVFIPFYNIASPDLYGLPFFYWFQTIWLVACTGFYLVFSRLKKGDAK